MVADETYGPRTRAGRGFEHHANVLRKSTIRALFDAEPNRFNHFSLEREGLVLDLSRQLLDRHALGLLVELAEQTEVPRWIELMFAGHPINNTEDLPALQVALRRPVDRPIDAWGENVMTHVETERRQMRALADARHAGERKGRTGRPITVDDKIGIGGSDLGIVMAVEALAEDVKPGLRVHFVSN